MGPGERTVIADDGTVIEVRLSPLVAWPRCAMIWSHCGTLFGGPCDGGRFMPWDHEPTDAEVLAEYEAWRKATVEER